jgi:FixJ family two-component response regulator
MQHLIIEIGAILNSPAYCSSQASQEANMTLRKLFVIDDDPGMLRTIERLLKVHGFDVQAFASAEAFLGSANPRDGGCLVLDIDLGGMSGIELRRQLTLSGMSLPVIFITAKDSEFVRKTALEVGCFAYLSKPFPAKQLMNAIEDALDTPA